MSGRSLRAQLDDPSAASVKPAFGFWTGGRRTVRDDRWRLIVHPRADAEPGIELFDYQTDPHESRNLAGDHPDVVSRLLALLEQAPEPSRRGR